MIKLGCRIKIGIFFFDIIHYHESRLYALNNFCDKKKYTVFFISLRDKAPDRPIYKLNNKIYNKIRILHNNGKRFNLILATKKLLSHFKNNKIDIVVIPGYNSLPAVASLIWSKLHSRIAILMSASKADDQPRKFWKEWLKSRIVQFYDAAIVGGTPQRDYAIALGIPPQRVFTGYDVVDNDYYGRGADAARSQASGLRLKLLLPRPYFLNVGRFIEKKNLFRLLEAYRIYRQSTFVPPWDLVLCGSGPLEAHLKAVAGNLAGVHFPGYKQEDELSEYYGLASVYIIPSSHFEQWGLVVNEAMASGLPVLVSTACGCAPDLVQEGVNGLTFDPYDVDGLARLLVRMSSGEVDLQAMGEASRRIIADWTPEVFAQNLFKAVEAAQEAKRSKRWWWGRA